MAQHNLLGVQGEDLATEFLTNKGYRILRRNWRYGKDEIDIICSTNEFIVFVEVKTRSSSYFGLPEQAVDKKKQRFLIRAADAYVNMNNVLLEVRYDIVSVIIMNGSHEVNHFEDAFYPTL